MINKTNKKKRTGTSKNGTKTSKTNSSALHDHNIMPFSLERNLSYVDSIGVRNNAGGTYYVYATRVNDLYDPDPLILTGSISGFKEIMEFYSNFRVNSVEVDITVSNLETFPITWGLIFSQINLVGSIASSSQAINVLENGLTTGSRMISAKGGIDKDHVKVKVPLVNLVGNSSLYKGDQNYIGSGAASPVRGLFVNFVLVAPTSVNLTNGVATMLKLTYGSSFFNRIPLNA